MTPDVRVSERVEGFVERLREEAGYAFCPDAAADAALFVADLAEGKVRVMHRLGYFIVRVVATGKRFYHADPLTAWREATNRFPVPEEGGR